MDTQDYIDYGELLIIDQEDVDNNEISKEVMEEGKKEDDILKQQSIYFQKAYAYANIRFMTQRQYAAS
uniref:Uncharacterized protein n=1 Tax=Acrobeloides nanus TaxID=290746 RepID=A0A914DDU5_9BILA